MVLKLTNTLTGRKEEISSEDLIDLYYCGLTVSDSPHLGHARGWIHVDVLRRWLEKNGHEVRHVENITDVNEKIFRRLSDSDISADTEQEVADMFADEVLKSKRMLNLRRANVYPRVSNHIQDIVSVIENLIQKGHAYESEGSVYFDVTTFDEYGKLSNQKIDAMETQGSPDEVEQKNNNADFALWKAVNGDKTRENTWQSPWSEGRPGWHIECSAMASKHLDTPIDIHIGGQDLVFPHHENEIAQSEAHLGEEFASHWAHIRLLNSGDDDQKMSTSKQNFTTVTDAIEEYGFNTVRWFILSSNYDSEQLYTEDKMQESKHEWDKVKATYEKLYDLYHSTHSDASVVNTDIREQLDHTIENIKNSLNNDLNTRVSLSEISKITSEVNRYINNSEQYDQEFLDQVLTFYENYVEEVFGFKFEHKSGSDENLSDILEYRDELRSNGKYDEADVIRNALNSAGYKVQDTEDGSTLIKS